MRALWTLFPARGLGLAAVLWLSLWAAINTGPWVFNRDPQTGLQIVHYVRATFPLLALFLAGLYLMAPGRNAESRLPTAARLWLLYGLVCLLGTVLSPRPDHALYWGAAYLAVLVLTKLFMLAEDPLDGLRYLNEFSWLVAVGLLLVLLVVARDTLFADGSLASSAYGVGRDVGQVGGMEMSRSTGMARFAAVPGIICLVLGLRRTGVKRLLWLAAILPSLVLLYIMESRGAALSFVAACAFVLFFHGRAARWTAAFLLLVVAAGAYGGLIPQSRVEGAVEHFQRGQSREELATLTGRTRAWEKATTEIKESPLVGYGQLADRYLIKEHVHNTYFYTLLCGGLFGTGFFVAGLVLAWLQLLRAVRAGPDRAGDHWTTVLQVGGILVFFTARSVPEVSGAMFGVDTMLMVPALAYLGLLAERMTLEERGG